MARLDLSAEWIKKYEDISKTMLNKGGIFDLQIEALKEEFEVFGITIEQRAELLTKLYMDITVQYNKDAISATQQLITMEADEPNKIAQTEVTERQRQGYDDNMLIKVGEFKSSVASFAVNSGSDSAQSSIDSMNSTLSQLDGRVIALDGQPACPVLPTPTPIPSALGISNETQTTMTVSWGTVINASTYELFIDGVSIVTTGQSVQEIDSLQANTKYAFNVRATVDGIVSDLSTTVIGATLV